MNALWPLLAISLKKNQMAQANDLAKEFINPRTSRIRDSLEAVLRSGVDLYEGGKIGPSKERFESAVQMAIDTGYF